MKHQRNGTDGLHIVRYIIALCTVTTGHGTHQLTILVRQRDGSPVELHFTTNLEVFVQRLRHLSIKLRHLCFRIGIGQRKHGIFMLNLHKILVQVTSHPHGRGMLIITFGMLGFQILQLTHQEIEGLVINLRCIQHIITMVVPVKLLTQLIYSFYFIHILKVYEDKSRQF